MLNLSAPFIRRPVGTWLLCLALVLAGMLAFRLLPVSPLPQMDFPVISVQASLPGASPQVMASSVATPLERALGSIAGLTAMSSRSTQGSTRIVLQFDLDKDITLAGREVQAAINAARALLPAGMRKLPSWRKTNPAQAPILVLALTSELHDQGRLYDLASTVLARQLAQVEGVGEVRVGGSSLPAVRVELQPRQLEQHGIALDEVRQTLVNASVRGPKGVLEDAQRQWQIASNDQLQQASDFAGLILREQDGAVLRLSDVARVEQGVEDRFNTGFYNRDRAVLLVINREVGANILQTIDGIRARLPMLQAALPGGTHLEVAVDRSQAIRATLREAEHSLLLAVVLVILVVLGFLGRWRAALIPALAVPVSLIGSFAAMYLLGFSLNNISLMALIVATGLVVDDAIVVLENITRHIEAGERPLQAALRGSREVGFTLLSMNLSLAAVFLAMPLMGGLVGRMFLEFAVTLTVAVLISLLVSLTLTPMLCARWLRREEESATPGALQRAGQRLQAAILDGYRVSLDWALAHRRLTLCSLLATIALNVWLFTAVPKTLVPQQDTGQLVGFLRSDNGLSFAAMWPKMDAFRQGLLQDAAVASVAGFVGGSGGGGNAFLIVRLKPLAERQLGAQAVVDRLRRALPKQAGAQLILIPDQDLRFGSRESASNQSELLLLGSDVEELRQWQPRLRDALKALPELTDVDAREGDGAQQIRLVVDRTEAARLGVSLQMLDALLNNAFSQRQILTLYGEVNQYTVVLGLAPEQAERPEVLDQLRLIGSNGQQIPLSAFSRREPGRVDDSVQHDGLYAVENVSFAPAEGVSLEQANAAIQRAIDQLALPGSLQTRLGGTAAALQQSGGGPLMLLVALLVVYLILGVLYESFIHPLTILSTLPSAGVGALLAILLTGSEFSLISLLGLFLLIGVVKKNAILMIDLALLLERQMGLDAHTAIRRACLLRFRPIGMTTLAAILGAVPLLLGGAEGAELRQPLGLCIIGGLCLSQLLTLYSTPVVYLYLDRWRRR